MSLIHDALKTAQAEKQRRDGARHQTAPLIVPLRSGRPAQFSWQRAVGLGGALALIILVGWFVLLKGRDRRPVANIPVPTPAVSLVEVPDGRDTIPAAAVASAAQSPAPATIPTPQATLQSASAAQPGDRPRATSRRAAATGAPSRTQETPAAAAAPPAVLPQREPVRSGRLRIAVEQGREGEAARLFSAGVAAHRAGDLAAARGAYEGVLRIVPGDVDALNNLGVLLAAQRDFERAEKLLRLAVELSPRNAGAWNNLGTVLAQRGQAEQASAAFSRSLEIDPLNQGARVSLAQQYLAMGAGDRAQLMLEEVLRANPAYPEAHYALGQAFELQQDWAGAVRAYTAFMHTAPARMAADVDRVRARVDFLSRRTR